MSDQRSVRARLGPIHLALVGTILLAAGARLVGIDAQSLWYDEGTTAALAQRGFVEILHAAANDIHPPLYYVVIAIWATFTGTSEYALRLPSAFFGILTVAGSAWLGRKAISELGGVIAGVLLGLSPLAIWYSQEARMYSLAGMLGVFAAMALLSAIEGRDRRGLAWSGFAILGALAAYTSYVAVGLLAALGLTATLARSKLGARKGSIGVGAAGLAVAVAFAPWLLIAGQQIVGWPAQSEPLRLDAFAARVSGLLQFGPAAGQLPVIVAAPLGITVFVVGFIRAWNRATPAVIVMLGLVGAPLAMFAASFSRPFFHAKFVSLAVPYFEILLAATLVAPMMASRGRWRGGFACAALITAVGLGAWRYDFVARAGRDPSLARDDYRGLVRSIESRRDPGAAVILNAPGQTEIFEYYRRADVTVYPLPHSRPPDRVETERALAGIRGAHGRVWLASWATAESDPEAIVERWLDRVMVKASSEWFGGVRLSAYLDPDSMSLPTRDIPIGTSFVGVGVLDRIEVADIGARPGDILPITLTWLASGSTATRLTTFVQLIDSDQYVWGQRDSEPLSGARPTTSWDRRERIDDRIGIGVIPGTPPGTYSLIVGMYDPTDGRRVVTSSGEDHIRIDGITVLPRIGGPRGAPRLRVGRNIGGLRLTGIDLHPLGGDQALPRVRAGQSLLLSLHWVVEAIGGSVASWRVVAHGVDGREVRQWDIQVDTYPPTRWHADEAIRVPKRLTTDGLSVGEYRLTLISKGASGESISESVAIGGFAIE